MKGVLIALGIIGSVMLLACGGFLVLIANMPKPTPQQVAKNKQELDIAVLMQKSERRTEELVRDVLKAPTTARFDLKSRHKDGKVVVVIGSVAAQNSFGAMLSQPIEAVFYVENATFPSTAIVTLDAKEVFLNEELKAKCDTILGS